MATDTLPPERSQLAQLFGRDSLYMVLWGVQLACAAALTPIITRTVGIGEFGTVASAIAVNQVLVVLSGFGLQTAIQRQHSRAGGEHAARKLLTAAIVLSGAFSLLAGATIAWWGGPLGFADGTAELRTSVAWAGLSAITVASLGLLRSQDRLYAFATVSLLQSVCAEAASLAFVLLTHPTAEQFLLGRVLAQAAAALVALLLAPPARLSPGDRRLVVEALGYCLPLVPAALSAFVLSGADRLIIQSLLGSGEVARYQVAYNIASVPMLLLVVLQQAWLPRFFSVATGPGRIALIAQTREALCRVLVPVVVGAAAGTPLLLRVWAPASYDTDGLALAATVVAIAAVPYAQHVMLGACLTTEGHTRVIAGCVGTAAVLNFLLNLLLVPPLGVAGSAGATLTAYLLVSLFLGAHTRRRLGFPALRGWTSVQLLAAAGLALLTTLLPPTTPGLWLRFLITATCLVLFGYAVRLVHRASAA